MGFVGFVTCEFLPIALPTQWWSAVLRIAFLCALVAGAVANARYADEFYRRVYLNSCAIALPACAIFFYAAGSFRIDLGPKAIGYVVVLWFVSFVAAFGELRRS